MLAKVEIKVINPIYQGVSKATGNPYTSQEIVVAWSDTMADGREFTNYQTFTLLGEQQARFAQLNPQVGMVIDVDIRFDTRQRNGRVYNDNALFLMDYEGGK